MRILFVVLFFLPSFSSLAQHPIAQFKLKSRMIEGFETHSIGDSILISFNYRYGNESKTAQNILMKADGSIEQLNFPEYVSQNIVKVCEADSQLHVYYFEEEQKSLRLRKLIYDKESHAATLSPEFIGFGNYIIGAFYTDDLLLLSKDKFGDLLVVSRIKDLKLIEEKKYSIPGILNSPKSIALIEADDRITPSHADALLKFYCDGNILKLTYDNPRTLKYTFQGYTEVITIDLKTDKVDRRILGNTTAEKFRTIFYTEYLYKITKGKAFQITIHKNDSLVRTVTLSKDLGFMRQKSLTRNGENLTVMEKGTAWDALSTIGDPFVTIHPADSGKLYLKVGTHTTTSPTVFLPTGAGLAGLLFGAFVTSASVAAHEADDVDRYFYLKGNAKEGFTYCSNPKVTDYSIDAFELLDWGADKETRYSFKRYVKCRKYTYGIYRKLNSEALDIVRYPN